jgi:uncharacterized YccA/Bax inhibitor family protein
MTVDTWLGVAGCLLGALGLLATILAAIDARRQRSARETAVIAAHAVIERTYGLLIGIKPFVVPLGPNHVAAIDDGLAAINQQRAGLKQL